jgi:hypothetical protein
MKVKEGAWMSGTITRIFAVLLIAPAFGACSERGAATEKVRKGEPVRPYVTKVELTLTGYNYTNRQIDQFSVNSNGGGNLYVSSPTSGGGGSTCCVTYVVGVPRWKVLVRWQADACTYNNAIESNGDRFYEIYYYFKESEVDVSPSFPDRPKNFEVHFYPDGHVEAAVSEHESAPRLKLRKEREDKTPYKPCPNDKRPEE